MVPSDKPEDSRREEQPRRGERMDRDRRFRVEENVFYEAGGWTEYRRLILSELERINAALHEIDEKIDDKLVAEVARLKVEVGMLQVRSGIWGAIAGIITTLSFILAALLGGKGILGGH